MTVEQGRKSPVEVAREVLASSFEVFQLIQDRTPLTRRVLETRRPFPLSPEVQLNGSYGSLRVQLEFGVVEDPNSKASDFGVIIRFIETVDAAAPSILKGYPIDRTPEGLVTRTAIAVLDA